MKTLFFRCLVATTERLHEASSIVHSRLHACPSANAERVDAICKGGGGYSGSYQFGWKTVRLSTTVVLAEATIYRRSKYAIAGSG
jgi:hypothetical protein